MVGQYVKGTGRCSDCGDWFYTKETDSNGRWIPEFDVNGQPVYGTNGKPRYRQHVHNCRGASSATKANNFENKLNAMASDVEATNTVNTNNLWSLAADTVTVRIRTENMEKQLEAMQKTLEKLSMDVETFLKSISKTWFTQANQLPRDRNKSTQNNNDNDDNGTDVADEIADTDDKTSLDSHSINFVASDDAPHDR